MRLFCAALVPRHLLPLAEHYEKPQCPKNERYNDNSAVGVEIEVIEDGDTRKAGFSNQDSIKALAL